MLCVAKYWTQLSAEFVKSDFHFLLG